MNETLHQLYDGYRCEMKRLLNLEAVSPQKFTNIEFVEYFERRIEVLDTLILLYADLLLAIQNQN